MSGLSPFPPSQTKAIWLPSGEKAACVSRPGKLVNGTMFKIGAGDILGGRKKIAQIATPSVNPSADQIANPPQCLTRGLVGGGRLSLPSRESAPFPLGLSHGPESES